MHQTGETIEAILDEIHRRDLVLPAIQREFVWRPEQVCRLFDSIMQGYPFGTFLYWEVQPENSAKFKFFEFVREYHQRDNPHCQPLPEMPNRKLTAVLDGQQRLTAFNIGLKGSMACKLPKKWWKNPDAFPVKKLYLDLLWQPAEEDEEDFEYRFKFLTEDSANAQAEGVCWFRVGDVLSMENGGPAMTRWLNHRLPQHDTQGAYEILYRLYEATRNHHLVAFYEEKSQELDKALQIFIRMNDGGTKLSHSDLLLSTAVAQWQHHDAREEIHNLVDELNGIGSAGFKFSQDLVLKAGLMLSDIRSIGFKVDNFSRENMEVFEQEWENIKRTLVLTVQLIVSFGFSGKNLSAHNAILPIAYYLHITRHEGNYLTHRRYREDRGKIRLWLIKSLLKKGVWGSGSDTLLMQLRTTIRKNQDDTGDNKENGFPIHMISHTLTRRGKSLRFDNEEIEDLADMRYNDKLTFGLLSLLFPFVDLQNQFHVDHIFPSARFSKPKLRDAGVPEERIPDFCDQKDRLANLQLLAGAVNNEKNAKMPNEWLSSEFDSEQKEYYQKQHLLEDVPDKITEFDDFYDQRRAQLKQKIDNLLGHDLRYS